MTERVCYWVARLVDPRETRHDVISLEFMPSYLSLGSDCYFLGTSDVQPTLCAIVASAQGPDSIDLVKEAQQKVYDAVTALTIVDRSRYGALLLEYSVDGPPARFTPRETEVYLESGYGRRPPLTPEKGEKVKKWYQLLRSSTPALEQHPRAKNAVEAVVQGLTENRTTDAVHLYRAWDEIRKFFGSEKRASEALGLANKFYRPIERARRIVAKSADQDSAPNKSPYDLAVETLPEAKKTAVVMFEAFLMYLSNGNGR